MKQKHHQCSPVRSRGGNHLSGDKNSSPMSRAIRTGTILSCHRIFPRRRHVLSVLSPSNKRVEDACTCFCRRTLELGPYAATYCRAAGETPPASCPVTQSGSAPRQIKCSVIKNVVCLQTARWRASCCQRAPGGAGWMHVQRGGRTEML